jgi:hypothetical protein
MHWDSAISRSSFRKILLGGIRELCEFDGSIKFCDEIEKPRNRYYSADENDSGTDSESVGSNSIRYSATTQSEEMNPVKSLQSPPSPKRSMIVQQPASLRRVKTESSVRPRRLRRSSEGSSRRWRKGNRPSLERSDSLESINEVHMVDIPYLDKLSWACEETGFSTQYADLVGSRFLG